MVQIHPKNRFKVLLLWRVVVVVDVVRPIRVVVVVVCISLNSRRYSGHGGFAFVFEMLESIEHVCLSRLGVYAIHLPHYYGTSSNMCIAQ